MRYALPESPKRREPRAGGAPGFLRRHAWWLLPLLVLDLAVASWLIVRKRPEAGAAPTAPGPIAAAPAPAPAPRPLAAMALPTPQTRLLDGDPSVFQDTGNGNPESGRFGSVRTQNNGGGLAPRFHEGVDIAATRRDARGRPLDEVCAAATGAVAYLNRVAGNSDYGHYAVLRHDDPAGPVYTLYAHLAAFAEGLAEGRPVAAGAPLGRMGNTALSPIPMARAHLHFEIGVMLNDRFPDWARKNQPRATGGRFNGQNLAGLDPLAVLRLSRERPDFSFADALAATPVAFELATKARRPPDYFVRHPSLWIGEPFVPGVMVLSVSEGGVPLRGRRATDEEAPRAASGPAVLAADEKALGRNGRAHVARRNGGWVLAANGRTWLDVLLYPP